MIRNDDFNRAALGEEWEAKVGTPAIMASTFFGGERAWNLAAYVGAEFPATQSVRAKLVGEDGELEKAQLWARYSKPWTYASGIRVEVDPGTTTKLWQIDGTTGQETLLADGSVLAGIGDVVRLDVNGETVRVFVNDVLSAEATTTILGAGQPALGTIGDEEPTLLGWDDFEARDTVIGQQHDVIEEGMRVDRTPEADLGLTRCSAGTMRCAREQTCSPAVGRAVSEDLTVDRAVSGEGEL